MLRRFSRFALVMAIACGACVRAPAPLDVSAMIKAHGEAGARGELEVRILDNPRDVQARLALAKLADKTGRPAQALEQYEAVLNLGGPLGTRWHDDDRARFARLLAVRGKVRLARKSATAFGDLERARRFGAAIDAVTLGTARSYVALDQLRHVDARTRAAGQTAIAELRNEPFADPSWFGAVPDATPRDRALFGVWLWRAGAKRAAYEALAAWREKSAERDAATSEFHATYLRALAWWTPLEGALPPTAELVGPERCRFVECSAAEIVREQHSDDAADPISVGPVASTTSGADAAAWAYFTLTDALHGGAPWGASLAQRVRVAELDRASVPAFARPVFARLAGHPLAGVGDASLDELASWQRLVVAADRVLAGASRDAVKEALGANADSTEGRAILRMLDPELLPVAGAPRDAAVGAFVRARGFELPQLGAIVTGYYIDPAIADRLARDVVAEAPDVAVAHAALGTLWSVLDDPARARTEWQAAVDASPEPTYVRGLADAAARAGDPDAALIHGTAAAAAAGDPARVWTSLSGVLESSGRHHHALEAARNAIDLAGREALAPALDAAIAASRAIGRTAQADALAVRRARLAPPPAVRPAVGEVDAQAAMRAIDDPTDPIAAIAAYERRATVTSIARMWIASRWNPGDVAIRAKLLEAIAPDDPRRRLIASELVDLAGSPDIDRGRAAIRALR